MEQGKQVLMQGEEVQRTISRMAHEIVEKNGGTENLALIGIRSKGAHLVRRIAGKIEKLNGITPPVGIIDITPYRDDIESVGKPAEPPPMNLPVSVHEKTVVLVDDVIYRGRTIRAALELVGQLGKPRRVLVAILVDRGERELPIKADIVGKNVRVADSQRVNVLLQESDGVDQVTVTEFRQRK
ncbi:MAG: bifunctional pyr operon transcriptional regulator/uracil phosphoribosyltransferase PyrR [Deltaproteobacteria bacterium]|nr:bifunctional pyr operon transcriptional regulator/uracil phosphoribosyltransferase PyrR [Deltaproteobacteria bacterium]